MNTKLNMNKYKIEFINNVINKCLITLYLYFLWDVKIINYYYHIYLLPV